MDQQGLNTLLTAIGSLGFPIVMCLILVFKLDKSIAALTTAITELRDMIYRTLPHNDHS